MSLSQTFEVFVLFLSSMVTFEFQFYLNELRIFINIGGASNISIANVQL